MHLKVEMESFSSYCYFLAEFRSFQSLAVSITYLNFD